MFAGFFLALQCNLALFWERREGSSYTLLYWRYKDGGNSHFSQAAHKYNWKTFRCLFFLIFCGLSSGCWSSVRTQWCWKGTVLLRPSRLLQACPQSVSYQAVISLDGKHCWMGQLTQGSLMLIWSFRRYSQNLDFIAGYLPKLFSFPK